MNRETAQRAFERCGTLADAIRAGLALGWEIVEVVVQDEFTHDIVMQTAPDGPAIVLDCT